MTLILRFRPVRRRDGYLALEDMGLIGDGSTSALVGLDGTLPWLCLPRFDSEPLFCGLLDQVRGGSFTVAPDDLIEARQRYVTDTAVLVTELRTPEGVVAVTDALALYPGSVLSEDAPAGRRELIRSATVLDGSERLRVEIEPRGGATAQPAAGGLSVQAWGRQDLDLHLRCNRPLESLRSVHELHKGERLDTVLSWAGAHRIAASPKRSCSTPRPAPGGSGWTRFTMRGRRRRSSAGRRSRSSCATTGATARSSPRRPRRCRHRSASCATGTTATPGSATPPSRSTRCAASDSRRRLRRSSAGFWTPSSTGARRRSCTTCRAAPCPTSVSMSTWRGTVAQPRCGGATVPLISDSTTSTARSSTAPISGQDHRRAEVVGTETHGKGVFQVTEHLLNGGALDISVGRYFSPDGHSLSGGSRSGAGITPNVYARDDPDTTQDEALVVAERTVTGKAG